MYLPKFELLSFSFLPSERKKIILRAMLEALIVTDWQFLEWYKDTFGERFPSLYDYAPKYVLKVRPGGLDSWQDIPDTIALGSGDCKDFACWRVAELRAQGIDAVSPVIKEQTYPDPNGIESPMTVYHIQVSRNGQIEDPSAILGMPTQVSYQQLRGDTTTPRMTSAGNGSRFDDGLHYLSEAASLVPIAELALAGLFQVGQQLAERAGPHGWDPRRGYIPNLLHPSTVNAMYGRAPFSYNQPWR